MAKRATAPDLAARRPETTVAGTIVIDMLAYLARHGADEAAVLAASALSPARPLPDERVGGEAVERLWACAERLTGDANLGLHMGEAFNPGALDIVGYVLFSCATARDLLVRLSRYVSLLNEGLSVSVVDREALTCCRFGLVDDRPNYLRRAPRHPVEATAAGLVATLRRLTNDVAAPVAVSFRHAAPPETAEHQRMFGPIVRFSEPADQLVFRRTALNASVISSNPGLLAAFEQRAEAALARLTGRGPVSDRVVRTLRLQLNGVAPSVGRLAPALAMSVRSLQRALRAEGTSFQRLLDQVRRELAVQHLARPGTSVSEVAFLLGFSEAPAFSRAFRRWTGESPAAVKARAFDDASRTVRTGR